MGTNHQGEDWTEMEKRTRPGCSRPDSWGRAASAIPMGMWAPGRDGGRLRWVLPTVGMRGPEVSTHPICGRC